MSYTIHIKNYLPSFVATRSAISSIKEKVVFTSDSYIFDFSNMDFISRSFADEFLKYIKSAGIHWEIANANPNIIAMINAVSNTQVKSHCDYDNIAIITFRNDCDLMNFLSTI